MKKFAGFSLVELVVVIGVSVILTMMSIPKMISWYKKDRFISQTEKIIDTLYDARAAALSEKKCLDGSSSTEWGWSIEGNVVKLICYKSSDQQEEKSINLDDNIEFSGTYLSLEETNGTLIPLLTDTKILINFLSGNSQAYITAEDGTTRDTYKIKKVTLPFKFSGLEDIKRTICFDRIAEFPTISSDENCYD